MFDDIFYGFFYTQLAAIWDDVNTPIFIGIVGAFFAAFAGAYGAQTIATNAERRKELLKEIRNTNAAILVTFTIWNSLFSLKDQHVQKLKSQFDKDQKEIFSRLQKVQAKQEIGPPISFAADYQTISVPSLPTAILQNIIFEKLSILGRALLLTNTLNQTSYGLIEVINARNQWIEKYKAASRPQNELIAAHFGLQRADGSINNDYPSYINAIFRQTDDCIYFSYLLCKDLVVHGEQVAKVYRKEFWKRPPKITKPQFETNEKTGLMPDAGLYKQWNDLVIKRDEKKSKVAAK